MLGRIDRILLEIPQHPRVFVLFSGSTIKTWVPKSKLLSISNFTVYDFATFQNYRIGVFQIKSIKKNKGIVGVFIP